MMSRFFTDTQTLQRLCEGPLGPYMEAYATFLHERGYSRPTARLQIRLVADMSRWLQRQGLQAKDINPQRVDSYLRYRRRRLRAHSEDLPAFHKLLNLLQELGVIEGQASPTVISAHQSVVNNFGHYLAHERGLAPLTISRYGTLVGHFLMDRFGRGCIQFTKLCAEDITGFVQRHAHDASPANARYLVTGLRAFFRYLRHQGMIVTDLADCVPGVANWKLATVPKFLPPDQVECVLQHCNRQTGMGRRDYAILLLLARLGLRAGEVVALQLDDIHWESGEIILREERGGRARLPLPQEVGEAIAAYLQNGRPACSTRRVFVRDRAPRVGFANSIAISTLVMRALERAGVDSPHKGAHLFRHSLATRMLRHGASLAEIGELLRHRHPDTTTIYAKVDLTALQALAQPWPGGDL